MEGDAGNDFEGKVPACEYQQASLATSPQGLDIDYIAEVRGGYHANHRVKYASDGYIPRGTDANNGAVYGDNKFHFHCYLHRRSSAKAFCLRVVLLWD